MHQKGRALDHILKVSVQISDFNKSMLKNFYNKSVNSLLQSLGVQQNI